MDDERAAAPRRPRWIEPWLPPDSQSITMVESFLRDAKKPSSVLHNIGLTEGSIDGGDVEIIGECGVHPCLSASRYARTVFVGLRMAVAQLFHCTQMHLFYFCLEQPGLIRSSTTYQVQFICTRTSLIEYSSMCVSIFLSGFTIETRP